jgi:hypothetical protein
VDFFIIYIQLNIPAKVTSAELTASPPIRHRSRLPVVAYIDTAKNGCIPSRRLAAPHQVNPNERRRAPEDLEDGESRRGEGHEQTAVEAQSWSLDQAATAAVDQTGDREHQLSSTPTPPAAGRRSAGTIQRAR